MKNLLEDIRPTLLMGPGPSSVAPATYHAMSLPTLGHLDPYLIKIMDGIKDGLTQLLNTQNRVVVPLSGTGSAGMEAAFVNMINKGDRVLILQNGVFGTRMVDVAGRLGAKVDELAFTWGTPVDVNMVKDQLNKNTYDIVAIVHAETSTGVLNPVDEVAKLIPEQTFFIVDCVTSLGGIPVTSDAWRADVVYSGSQKCLSCPPGASPITFSERAMQRIAARADKVPNWYLDMNLLTSYWGGATRVYHHTAPINMLYALYQSIQTLLEEGLENSFARHKACHELLAAQLPGLGLSFLVEDGYRLPMLNTVTIPDGVNDASVRARLLDEFAIEIGAGLGALAGKVWRIGLMGHTAQPHNVERLVAALKECLA